MNKIFAGPALRAQAIERTRQQISRWRSHIDKDIPAAITFESLLQCDKQIFEKLVTIDQSLKQKGV